jgi:hypothetical protein
MFVHVVLFWLKDGSPKDAAEKLARDAEEVLGKIPSIRKLWTGRPAMTPRDVVDNSYDVGLCVILDDVAGHDEYQVHPQHKEFIDRNKPHWKRVQIYDFK